MKSNIEIKTLKISMVPALRCAKLALLAFALTPGHFIGNSYPFGIALVSAVSGVDGAASAAIGCVIGSLFIPSGIIHAAVILGVFLLRFALGSFLCTGDPTEEKPMRGKNDGIAEYALKRIAFASRKAFSENTVLKMTVSAVAAAAYSGAVCVSTNYVVGSLAGAFVSILTAPAAAFFYSSAVQEDAHERIKETGRIAFAVTLVMSLRTFPTLLDLSLPAAFIITVLATSSRGILHGVLYGLACGGVLEASCVPMYILSAFVFGILKKTSPAIGVSAACSVSCLWSLYAKGLSAMNYTVPALIITSAVTAPLVSSDLFGSKAVKCRTVSVKDDFSANLLRRATVKKLHSLSECMKDLSGVLFRLSDKLTSPENEFLCELCRESFEESCKECGMQNACYGREADRTASLQAKMTLSLKRDGRVSAADVPPAMIKRCYSIDRIIDRMNAGYARLVSEAKLYDRTSVVAEDYGVISDMLRESSDEDAGEYTPDTELTRRLRQNLGGRFTADKLAVYGGRLKRAVAFGIDMSSGTPGGEDMRRMFERACGLKLLPPEFELDGASVNMILKARPVFSVKSGRASVAASQLKAEGCDGDADTKIFPQGSLFGLGRGQKEVCGDVISSFLTSDGRFFMLISDGMGSGNEASLTSGVCAVFLEKLLCAGASMDTSLKMLNSMMRVRGREVSATVDLMELDLMNGCTRFVKSGAAPSFVLRGGRLFRLQSKTVPIGIVRALDAELIKFDCEKGDVIVMLSDGVAKSFEDCPWLYDLLCDESSHVTDPDEMARHIISCAVENGASDDVTAGVVIVE